MSHRCITLSLCSTFFLLFLAGCAAPPDLPPPDLAPIRDLIGEGRYEEAEAAARELLAQVEASHGTDSAAAAAVLDPLVESLWRGGKVHDAETKVLAERALSTKEETLGPASVELAESLNNLAVIDFFLGKYGDARNLWDRALEIRQRELGPDHPDVARIQNSLGNLHQWTANYDEALRLYDAALKIREQTYGPDHPAVGQTLHNLANLLMNTGDYPHALELAERSLAIKEAALGPEHPKVAETLNLLGNILWETGDYESAMVADERAETIWIEAHGPDHPEVAASLNNRAENLRRVERYEDAKLLYERAQAIWEEAYGPDNPDTATSLRSLGQLLEAMGDNESALEAHERVVAIREEALDADHPFLAMSLVDLGTLRAKQGDYSTARPLLERAVTIQRESLGPDHPSVADATVGLASVLAWEGEEAQALELALQAEQIARDHLRLTGRSMSERHALQYAASRVGGLDLALTLSVDGLEPSATRAVLDSLVRSRAIVLDEIAARSRMVNLTDDPEITRLAEELAGTRSHLANLTVRGLGTLEPEQYREVFEAARQKKEDAERDLAAASVEFARELGRGKLGLKDVIAGLPDRGALVAYVLYDRSPPAATSSSTRPIASYAAFVVGREHDPVVVQLGPANEIGSLVSQWKREAAGGVLVAARSPQENESRYREVAAHLRARVWDPLTTHLRNADRVFVVPDGELNLVSLAALPSASDGYLIEDGPLLHYLSAERDIAPSPTRGHTGEGLLAVGGPDFDADSVLTASRQPPGGGGITTRGTDSPDRISCIDFDQLQFEPLVEADREARQVVAIWNASHENGNDAGRVIHLSGADARESKLTEQASGRRVLHLATHGFFLGQEASDSTSGSRGLGTLSVVGQHDVTSVACENPLLLSGLALAGANQRMAASSGQEDGILTAEEIAGLDLAGVEWAVLSACDTGVGEIQAGEGVFGLRRAFQVAGVRTLIMSLWEVDDEATRQWMNALYEGRFRNQLDTVAAVHAANVEVLNSRRDAGQSTHPFFWAAFVAAGDWQ